MPAENYNSALPLEEVRIAINEGLMVRLVRQHELTEQADLLNIRLQEEIAARKNAEEALVSVEKLASVGRMAAVLAHEINNPLEAIMNVVYLTRMVEGLPDAAREYLETADAQLKRIAHITRQTLGFYREISTPKPFQVTTLFDSVLDLLQAKITSKRAMVEKRCPEDLEMNGFHGEIRQVFSNLLMNSLDAVAEGGRVTLKAGHSSTPGVRERRLRFTVSDNGHGIDPSAFDDIFKPFFTTKGSVGNGLGLWVSRQIVEKHGGMIQIRSTTHGAYRGTTVSVILPQESI